MADVASLQAEIESLRHTITILTGRDEGSDVDVPGLGPVRMPKLVRRTYNILRARMGKTVSRNTLFEACYFDKPEDRQPDSLRIVDVLALKVRKAIAGATVELQLDWGVGYRLVERAQ